MAISAPNDLRPAFPPASPFPLASPFPPASPKRKAPKIPALRVASLAEQTRAGEIPASATSTRHDISKTRQQQRRRKHLARRFPSARRDHPGRASGRHCQRMRHRPHSAGQGPVFMVKLRPVKASGSNSLTVWVAGHIVGDANGPKPSAWPRGAVQRTGPPRGQRPVSPVCARRPRSSGAGPGDWRRSRVR